MPEQILEKVCDCAERLDVFAAAMADVTRSRAGALIADGMAAADGTTQTKAGFRLKPGMRVTLRIPEAAPAAAQEKMASGFT